MATINKYYDNFVLQNEVNNMYDTALDMSQFCTPDTSLVGVAGDIVKINTYDATSAAEEVEPGVGNSKAITTTLATKQYQVKTVQSRFAWLDEEERRDPIVPVVGTRKLGADLVNKMNADIFAEFRKATLYQATTNDYFADFVDAVSKLTLDPLHGGNGDESLQPTDMCFALVNKTDVAAIRKSMKDMLKYVEAFVRTGYIGTVAGVNLYVSNSCKAGEIIVANRYAVRLFTKNGVELERDREVNIRKNWVYARQVYVPVLYDATKAIIINKTGAKEEQAASDQSSKPVSK